MKKTFVAFVGLAAFAQGALADAVSDADFAARCSAPGVVRCFGFDNSTTDIVRNVNLSPDGQGNFRAGLDTTIKASGGGSLRFDLPPPPHAGANIGGSWVPSGGWGAKFSENSTFYVQYRLRLSPYMVQNGNFGGSIWKTTIFHSGVKTCASIELTTSAYYGNPLAQLDTDCGGRWMWTTLDGSQYTNAPPLLMQQTANLQCAYGVNYAEKCETYAANDWMTLYYRIQIGTWNQPNSNIDAWLGHEGAALKQFVKMRNFSLSCNATSCTSSPDKDDGYDNVTITPYMTGLSPSVGPSATANMWFDEFIVSRQPIAPPSGAPPSGQVRPSPPGNVQAN